MIDKALIKKYNVAGPRYTSYPPANHFQESFNEIEYVKLLKNSNDKKPESISLYIHIPFCPQICYFCGCNTNLFKDEKTVANYVNSVINEIELVAQYLQSNRRVIQIHWGGGTPNSISFQWIEKIMNFIHQKFQVVSHAEVAMECNPAYLELEDILRLSEMGFNRLSLGVQDFNPEILKRLNRIPSRYPLEDIYRTAKKAGFKGINIDLIYGLPGQKPVDFFKSVQRAIKISPERLVTFSYAHVPWFKEHQKKLEKYTMPDADEKLDMLQRSFEMLTDAGYQAIGMDHYAKPEDELYQALQNKELHRNFQGYCTRETTGQVYAFGATAISQLTDGYAQNVRSVKQYKSIVDDGKLPVFRGYALSEEEKIIRSAITEIMCNHYINFSDLAVAYQKEMDQILKILDFKKKKLDSFIEDELVELKDDELRVKPKGFFLIRNIAMAFDPMLKTAEKRYSKTI
jgi:oxygen-independent coproporphyrinogen-3 oxidase